MPSADGAVHPWEWIGEDVIRKAVFPAAGLGTRFLPATKAQPKEMLPLVDKPIIQYGVEEAVASGVDNIILVTGRGKNAIEDHFDVSVELETFLEARGKKELLAEIRKISNLINFAYVRQGEPLGLGHAVLVTRALVGDEPFAVILGDDVIDANPPALRQMIDVFEEVDGPVLAVERCPRENVSSYGIIDADEIRPGVYRIRDLVEKPPREEAPSDLAIIGRYILTPDIFPALAATVSDRTGEIQLTNGLRRLLKIAPDLRLPRRRRPPRHRQQARVPEGGGVLRAATAGPRGTVPRLPPVDRSRARRDDAVQARRYSLGFVVDAGVESPDEELPESVLPPDPESVFGRSRIARLVASRLRFSDEPRFLRRARLPGVSGGLLRVVRDVEPGPLELDRRRREQLADRSAALRAGVGRRIRKLLDLLEPVLAGLALIFVEGHERIPNR